MVLAMVHGMYSHAACSTLQPDTDTRPPNGILIRELFTRTLFLVFIYVLIYMDVHYTTSRGTIPKNALEQRDRSSRKDEAAINH